jgi:hypothetical protein
MPYKFCYWNNVEFKNRYHSPDIMVIVDGLHIWGVAANILNKQSRTADNGWSSILGVGRGLTTLSHSEDQGVGGKMGSEYILGRLAWGGDWIRLVQNKDRWLAVVSAVMNLRVLAPRN